MVRNTFIVGTLLVFVLASPAVRAVELVDDGTLDLELLVQTTIRVEEGQASDSHTLGIDPYLERAWLALSGRPTPRLSFFVQAGVDGLGRPGAALLDVTDVVVAHVDADVAHVLDLLEDLIAAGRLQPLLGGLARLVQGQAEVPRHEFPHAQAQLAAQVGGGGIEGIVQIEDPVGDVFGVQLCCFGHPLTLPLNDTAIIVAEGAVVGGG